MASLTGEYEISNVRSGLTGWVLASPLEDSYEKAPAFFKGSASAPWELAKKPNEDEDTDDKDSSIDLDDDDDDDDDFDDLDDDDDFDDETFDEDFDDLDDFDDEEEEGEDF
ncbi:MAG: hypothetical protein HYR55_05790 [Acidobacteria bacterium]|nr:hypothetical protein [Acidobacteriota bacterium]MBI3654875.1 hypothetical protein [Acidobacteriota bacterium]